MNLKKLTPVLLQTIMILAVSNCKENKKVAVNHNLETNIARYNFCDEIKASGTNQILCKSTKLNTIIISKTPKNKRVHFFVELFSNKNLESVVRHTDSIIDCPVDFFIDYFDESLEINDLDEDGTEEITFLYEKACRGGVAPANLRLVKIEGKEIYIIKGKRILKMDEKNVQGTHSLSPNFSNAPKVFVDHAIKKWKNYLIEK